MFNNGKLVRPSQPHHALKKLVPAAVLNSGKLVKPRQSYHASLKSVPAVVFTNGKLVTLEQPDQAWLKLFTVPVTAVPASLALMVILAQPMNAASKLAHVLPPHWVRSITFTPS